MKLIDADKLKKAILCRCQGCYVAKTDWCKSTCPIGEFISILDDADYISISNNAKDISEFLLKGEKD